MYECDVWAAANSESGTASKTNSALARPENKLVYYFHHNFYTVYPRTSALGIFVFGGGYFRFSQSLLPELIVKLILCCEEVFLYGSTLKR